MAEPIKPRYKLGTQDQLDAALNDARLIPKATLFRLKEHANGFDHGYEQATFEPEEPVVRGQSGPTSDNKDGVRIVSLATGAWTYATARMLKPY